MDINNDIFEFVYEISLRDATLQKAYTGSIENLRKNKEAKKLVKEYIDKIMEGKVEDDSFINIAREVEKSFEGYKPSFTFGNVQKLINMSIKYMYIVCYNNKKTKKFFDKRHCPMDSIMVDLVIKQLEEIKKEDLTKEDLEKINNEFLKRGNKTFLRKGWSKIQSDGCYDEGKLPRQYELYQEIVRFLAEKEGCSPIEYDYIKWNK